MIGVRILLRLVAGELEALDAVDERADDLDRQLAILMRHLARIEGVLLGPQDIHADGVEQLDGEAELAAAVQQPRFGGIIDVVILEERALGAAVHLRGGVRRHHRKGLHAAKPDRHVLDQRGGDLVIGIERRDRQGRQHRDLRRAGLVRTRRREESRGCIGACSRTTGVSGAPRRRRLGRLGARPRRSGRRNERARRARRSPRQGRRRDPRASAVRARCRLPARG